MIKTLNTTKWLLYHLPTFIQDSSCVPIDEIPEEINRLKLFDKILVSSSSFIKYCHAIYPPEIIRKMVPILPGRNFELTEMPKREKKGTISRILSIGTICKRKGQKRLVEALAQIREQDWKLILIGNTSRHPQEVKEIKQLMKKHNLKISIRRNVSEVEKVKELQSADIFALPTCFETFGIALQEAMEFGLPIVTGNHMILRDWIGQNNAIFVDPLSPVEIQQGLRLLLEDSTLRTKLGQAAFRKVLDQNNWDETQESFLQLLGKEGLT
ncbi:MAG: glycosyltransferase [Methanobacteriota archaeon]|nr:MAG: glycosyltransferase [Euryarchaeota archaeon]